MGFSQKIAVIVPTPVRGLETTKMTNETVHIHLEENPAAEPEAEREVLVEAGAEVAVALPQ